jgi:hypothetical protein
VSCTSNRTSKSGSWSPRKISAATLLTLCLLATPGVLAQKITVEFDQAADFSRYKTFAMREGQLNSNRPALSSELIKKKIEADIEQNLTARVSRKPTDVPI